MRKLVTIAVLLVYALSSSGTSFYLHYCCGLPHVLAINEQPETHEACGLCAESEHHGEGDCAGDTCDLEQVHHGCQDVYVDTVDATNEHITHTDKNVLSSIQPIEIVLPWSVDVSPFVAEGSIVSFSDSSPPLISDTPLFIFHCTYLI